MEPGQPGYARFSYNGKKLNHECVWFTAAERSQKPHRGHFWWCEVQYSLQY